MPTNFTGSPEWRETIAGPANSDEITGPSVSDMGVLLADRGQWQKQGTIGYYDEKTATVNVSGGTGEHPLYTAQMALDVATSRVLVTQSLPACFVTDGDVTVELCLFDESDVLVDQVSTLLLVEDTSTAQLILVGGFENVAAGTYSFGIRVVAAGAAKFDFTGNIRTIAQAYPLEGT